MNHRIITALTATAILLGAPASLSQTTESPSDADVAAEYSSEAAQLREKAQSHRKMAKLYRARKPPKSDASYEGVAKHCDKLAQYYEDAANEAQAVAAELSK